MNQDIFRAYSIRGIAGKTLTARDMALIGRAAGTLLGQAGISTVAVGRDHRLSSPQLASALTEGLLATGMHVIDIGTCPTPILNYATDYCGAGAGLMVTASHNPAAYNGLKIRTDHSLRGEELRRIYQVANEGAFCQGQGTIAHVSPLGQYLDAIAQRVTMHRPLRLVVDGGSGAAGPVVPPLLERLGCQVIPIDCEPDGRFPHHAPDPTAPGALDALSARVIVERADAGLAYDGDGDRLAMVDGAGRQALADQLLALLARETLAAHPGGKVVYELSCTQALSDTVSALGGRPIPCAVGYAFVHQAMRDEGAILGGESSGHLFFADPDFRFDDAVLATAKMVALLSRAGKPLSALLAELPPYTLSPKHRFHCPDEKKEAAVAHARERFAALGHSIECMDGVKVTFGDGWGLFRASNTQPAVTMRCEAKSPERLSEIERVMLDAVRDALVSVGVEMRDGH